ncbi:MAG: DUF2399 domain-containing protein [Eubacteriaceae bacterium]|nr:DUF2399 domain-containing protein [Eubacteriaceae bacterium]
MIGKYEKTILNSLLDKYEKSKSFTGGNKVNQRFFAKVAALFPKYADHANFEVFQVVNEAIDILARKGMITAKISKANVCSEITLNPEEIQQSYHYIGRIQKKEVNFAVLELLDKYKDRNDILQRFCQIQIERIQENRSIQFFGGDLQEFGNILRAVDLIFKVESETFVRDFSVRVFKDSKIFDHIRFKVVSLLYEYGDFPEKDQVLESLNIIKNPTYINFKGAGAISISRQRIDMNLFKGDIAISSSMLGDVDRIEITGKIVMTVENLTSFHTVEGKDAFLIYLGGFHNRIRREFIKKIHLQNPNAEFYHFGDIDAGGFHILEHLRKATGVEFKPYKMDLDTLKCYQNYSKSLTENDKERLKRFKDSEFAEVIDYMLENNCKLEQEAIQP